MTTSTSENRLNRIAFVGIGVSLGFGGSIALYQRGFYSSFYAQFIDFGPHHQYVGVVLIALGVAIAWVGVRRGRARRLDG